MKLAEHVSVRVCLGGMYEEQLNTTMCIKYVLKAKTSKEAKKLWQSKILSILSFCKTRDTTGLKRRLLFLIFSTDLYISHSKPAYNL